MNNKVDQITLQLNSSLYKSLEIIAKLHSTTVDQVITDALIDYTEKASRSADLISSFLQTKRQV